jgi:YegS/Rv2252/BmrU family lipid kinase
MAVGIGLLAHPDRLDDLVRWMAGHRGFLEGWRLLVPEDLARLLLRDGGFGAEGIESLPLLREGGDIQLAARALDGALAGIICFADPLAAATMPPDLRLLLRVSQLRSIPLALDAATAELAVRGLARSRTAWLIFNPVAGQGNPDQELALIRSTLEPQILVHVVMTRPEVDPADQAREIVAMITAGTDSGTRLIIASGGDGTVSAVAGAVIGTGVPLGVIPRGTANAFSVALGIPTNLKGACDTILAGNTHVMDAARCNDLPMILLAGIGFEAGMVNRATRELKNAFGPLAYVLAGAQQFANQQPFHARLEIDGEQSEVEASAITVANVAPPTSVLAQGFGEVVPDDGLLEVTIATPPTRLQGLNALASLMASAVVRAPTVREDLLCLRARAISIDSDPPQPLVIDGEMLEANPVRIECLPKSLTLFAPLASP